MDGMTMEKPTLLRNTMAMHALMLRRVERLSSSRKITDSPGTELEPQQLHRSPQQDEKIDDDDDDEEERDDGEEEPAGRDLPELPSCRRSITRELVDPSVETELFAPLGPELGRSVV